METAIIMQNSNVFVEKTENSTAVIQSFKGKLGGARPNAGRKAGGTNKNTQKAIEVYRCLVDTVHREMKPIIEALVGKAKSGDVSALNSVMDRVVGKPVETMVHLGEVSLKLDLFQK